MKSQQKSNTVDAYIRQCPSDVAKRLRAICAIVRKIAPEAEELVSYGMPAYKLNGRLLYLSAFSRHIGFYALPSAVRAFKKDLVKYKTSTGTVQFRHDEPLPLPLIKKMVTFRVKEQRARGSGGHR